MEGTLLGVLWYLHQAHLILEDMEQANSLAQGCGSPECEATMPLPNLLNCLWLQGEVDTCFKVVTLGSQFQEKRQTSRSITGTIKAKESGKDLSHVTLVTYFCSLLFFFFFLYSVDWPFSFKWARRPSDVLNLFIIKHNPILTILHYLTD